MNRIIFDIETDSLLEEVSKIHCLSYRVIETGEKNSLTDYKDIVNFFKQDVIFVGHNIILYDLPVLKKILQIEYPKRTIDTLIISWYMYPERDKHSLEDWGLEFDTQKVKVTDWENLSVEEYVKRCEQDVVINTTLFEHLTTYLSELYEGNTDYILNYLSFKLQNLLVREENGIHLDLNLCIKSISKLEPLIDSKFNALAEILPKQNSYQAPKVMYKKDGNLSLAGENWMKKLQILNLPEGTTIIYENGNPNSVPQLKAWLFSLGWEPQTFKINDKGEKVPQISLPFGQGLCPSIQDLFEQHPVVQELDSYYMLKHRKKFLEGFLETADNNLKIYCRAQGLTNTLRWQHCKPIANMPGADKPYGKDIRNCLTIPNKDYIMFGVDISALEDSTKQHYIYFFDPDYVNDMRVPGFDAHLDIATLANLLQEVDSDYYKWYEKTYEEDNSYKFTEEETTRFKKVKKIRGTSKQVNFACVYGAGAPKIAETARIPLQEAKNLHKIYWQRNKAVKLTVNNVITKTVNNQLWLFNPISKLWLYVKNKKDIFSTLNQSSGVFVFDMFIFYCVKRGLIIPLEYHDEIFLYTLQTKKEEVYKLLQEAINDTNNLLKLNVPIKISIQTGTSYGSIH
jgi:hypothetical protein